MPLPLSRARVLILVTSALAALLAWLTPGDARAFCGFYVSGADAKLLAEATQVVLMREGTRTVLSMQNDYKGPPEGFALVVPVPVVLQKENVKTLARDVFDRVDKLSAPRLVEYWEQDPCSNPGDYGMIGLSGTGVGGGGFGNGSGRLGGAHTVTVEAQFEVGEYEIVILSAQDSGGLDAWLRGNGYKIPPNAEPALRPYVQAGSKFFVAKVNVAKVKFEDGRASLSPLRFHYDSDKFELPVRLGMLNSSGTQDLVVQILAPEKRYVVANYPSVTIPTNLAVAEAARASFPAFYAALLDKTLERTPGAIVTEYAWPSSSCDPCPGNVSGLSPSDVATLGGDVLPAAKGAIANGGRSMPLVRQDVVDVKGGVPTEVVQRIVRQNFGRFRLCYESALKTIPGLTGKVTVAFDIDASGAVLNERNAGSGLSDSGAVQCVVRAFHGLSFPQPDDGKSVHVTYGLALNLGTGFVGWAPFGNMVLTRLHARYGKDALGSDLVFKEAPPIVGGRELRGEHGALETGAVPSEQSSFQARYVIRHEWPGAIACKDPRRGTWGVPWPDAGVTSSAPVAAQKLAYARRGNLTLSAFVPSGIPELAFVGGGGPEAGTGTQASAGAGGGEAGVDGGAVVSTATSRCGCRVISSDGGGAAMLAPIALFFTWIVRRKRRPSA